MADFTMVLQLSESPRRLDREAAITKLKSFYENGSLKPEDEEKLISILKERVSPVEAGGTAARWETRHGALLAMAVLVERHRVDGVLLRYMEGIVQHLLEDEESRVRIETGVLIGRLCAHHGVEVFNELKECIFKGIHDNIERDSVDNQLLEKLGRPQQQQQDEEGNGDEEQERPSSPTAAQIFHDTAGWKTLETYMNALHHAVDGCGDSFEPYITSDLFDLLFTALKHTNRFVREMGYKVISAIVKCEGLSEATKDQYWLMVSQQLAKGLSDNWSQVRMSASVATREFLSRHCTTPNTRQQYLPILLPPMCLNRYYIAEGVRLYSQETWRRVTDGKGIQLVEQYIQEVVLFYVNESMAANHAVREAACACIAELGSKVSSQCLRPHVTDLIKTLLDCFKDDSWPVRDAACLACGKFVLCFPEECRPLMKELFPLFLGNLEDSIPSVRQGAAAALANVVQAYGPDMETRVFSVIKDRLPLVAEQPPTSSESLSQGNPGIDPSPAVFGVVKRVLDQDIEAHTNQQMYSCGSLAPKMKRGGGCMDHQFHKQAQPWEKSEGCVHLLTELSQLKQCQSVVASILPLLADSTRHKQYSHHFNYLDTVLKQLPSIAKSIGKRPFKQHLELFLDAIFYSLDVDYPQLQVTSAECLQLLSVFIGPSIFKGRVEQYNPSYIRRMQSILIH